MFTLINTFNLLEQPSNIFTYASAKYKIQGGTEKRADPVYDLYQILDIFQNVLFVIKCNIVLVIM